MNTCADGGELTANVDSGRKSLRRGPLLCSKLLLACVVYLKRRRRKVPCPDACYYTMVSQHECPDVLSVDSLWLTLVEGDLYSNKHVVDRDPRHVMVNAGGRRHHGQC